MMTSIIQNVIEISVRSGNADKYFENCDFQGFRIENADKYCENCDLKGFRI